MRNSILGFIFILSLATGLFTQCSTSRAITNSGKVTPQGTLQGGIDITGNIPTAVTTEFLNMAEDFTKANQQSDSVFVDQSLNNAERALYSYALDPLSAGSQLFIRYGIYEKFDIGYLYASGVHRFDAAYQFWGPTGKIGSASDETRYGSVGIQYAYNKYELPDVYYLRDLQEMLGFEYTRHDIQIPITFSNSFGAEEKYGRIAYGAVYAHTFLSYSLFPENIYNSENELLKAEHYSNNFSSFGAFTSIKVGYKYAYLTASLTVYYQNYGKYKLLSGETAEFSGFTYIPTLGLHFMIYRD